MHTSTQRHQFLDKNVTNSIENDKSLNLCVAQYSTFMNWLWSFSVGDKIGKFVLFLSSSAKQNKADSDLNT